MSHSEQEPKVITTDADAELSVFEKIKAQKNKMISILAISAVAACGSPATAKTETTPTPSQTTISAEVTPGVSPTAAEATISPTETASPTENADVAFNIEADKHSTFEQFAGRPRAEQVAFAWDNFMLQISDGIAANFFVGVPYGSNKSLDKYNPAIPGVVSKDNNGQEIVSQNLYAQQYAAAQGMDPNALGTSTANIPLEQKLLAGEFYYTDSKKDPRYAVGLNKITSSETTQLIIDIDTVRVDKFSPLQKGVDKDGQAIEYVDTWVNSGGNTEIERYIYYTFAGKDNQTHDIWLFAGARAIK